MTDQTFNPGLVDVAGVRQATARMLQPTALFWLSMFVASALGTNIGDFWADSLGLGLPTSFASLAIICALFIWGDRENGVRTEAFYWLAIISLRAVATNVGDFLTHTLALNYLMAAIAIGALTLMLGVFTRRQHEDSSPKIDLRYWGTMFAAGVFGTIGGDLVAHTIGLFLAALVLAALLVAVIRLRDLTAPTALVGYWCVVLAERAAGTPMGDWLAKSRGLGLGLPVSMILVAATLTALLAWRSSLRTEGHEHAQSGAALVLLLCLRPALLVLSAAGSFFMLRLYFVEHPGNPSLVLAYGIGLAVNTIYLAVQEWRTFGTSAVGRLVALWWSVKQEEFDLWFAAKEAALRGRGEQLGSAKE